MDGWIDGLIVWLSIWFIYFLVHWPWKKVITYCRSSLSCRWQPARIEKHVFLHLWKRYPNQPSWSVLKEWPLCTLYSSQVIELPIFWKDPKALLYHVVTLNRFLPRKRCFVLECKKTTKDSPSFVKVSFPHSGNHCYFLSNHAGAWGFCVIKNALQKNAPFLRFSGSSSWLTEFPPKKNRRSVFVLPAEDGGVRGRWIQWIQNPATVSSLGNFCFFFLRVFIHNIYIYTWRFQK